jgi:hypothetical protein
VPAFVFACRSPGVEQQLLQGQGFYMYQQPATTHNGPDRWTQWSGVHTDLQNHPPTASQHAMVWAGGRVLGCTRTLKTTCRPPPYGLGQFQSMSIQPKPYQKSPRFQSISSLSPESHPICKHSAQSLLKCPPVPGNSQIPWVNMTISKHSAQSLLNVGAIPCNSRPFGRPAGAFHMGLSAPRVRGEQPGESLRDTPA